MILGSSKEKSISPAAWTAAVNKLLEEQMESWPLLKNNVNNLSRINTRKIEFDGFEIVLQHNPERITSTTAQVDSKSISMRPCFLCLNNLPCEQSALEYNKHYLILCNPYPIFPGHLTITHRKHIPQNLVLNFDDLLEISRDLNQNFTLFYNGPNCGASAPDHLHFQAIPKKTLPLENEITGLKKLKRVNLIEKDKTGIIFLDNYLRYGIVMESSSKGELQSIFKIVANIFRNISPPNEEPMWNIISSFNENKWTVAIFPRRNHRPDQYYKDGSAKIMISPAAVDLGGVFVLPREEDWEKIGKHDVIDIFNQVSVTKEFYEYLRKKITDYITK